LERAALVGGEVKHLVDKARVGANELKGVVAQVRPDVCPLVDDILSQLGLHILQESGATPT